MENLKKKLKSAEKSKSFAFYKFYEAENEKHEYQLQVLELFKKLQESETDKVPDFLINELKDMYEITKKSVECPICFEELSKDDIKFSSCGHKFCAECLSKIDNCAICRKKIFKKK